MKLTPQLGLGNSVEENVEILHSGILGNHAFGRVSDLIAAWCAASTELPPKPVSDLRIMIQALLSFAHPQEESKLSQFEFAIEEQQILAAIRFENDIFENTDSVERVLSQYWLNSEDALLLKKVLYPKDRVEVRFNSKLNLIEWRVCRSLKPESITHQDPSFLVFIDDLPAITSESIRYTELGDLPYQEWLSEIYKNKATQNRSGEFFVQGESLQNETEWARVVVDREKGELESDVRHFKSNSKIEDDDSVVFEELSYEENERIQERSRRYVEDMRSQLLTEQAELKENVKEVVAACKKRELRAVREVALLQQKIQMFEKLLHKKELQVQKGQSEVRVLNDKLQKQEQTRSQVELANQINAFREKAVQMYDQLKAIKEENRELEQKIVEIQHREKVMSNKETSAGGMQIEELTKKLERLQRALDGEKVKVKTLSERVIVAEKEAQSAGPLIEDLEKKVENTLKVAQQHKKETEQMKLKLVQADAEKNKIKNELVKAQAQIQTLMKRHAS